MKDIEPLAQSFLDKLGDEIIALGNRDGIKPRLNILVVYREKRRLFWGVYLRVAWSREMEFQPDMHATFSTSKGVAGEVVKEKAPRLADIERYGHQTWGFSEREARLFPKLTAIYGWPIYQLDRHQRLSAKILGTVNLDAQEPGALARLVRHKAEYDALLKDFAKFASAILSLS